MRHHRSAHINAPYETVYVSGTDGVSWEASPGFHLRSCRVYGKNAVKTYAGYNLINNNSFVPVKTSSSVSAATVSATATGITGWAYSSNYLKTTVSLTPGTKYKFSSLVQTTKPLVVYAGGSKLLDIPAGSGVRSAEFTPILPSYEMKICQAADEEGHFGFADLMLYAASLGTPEYEPYTGGVDKSVFLLNNCVYTGGSDTITKAQSLAAVDDVCDEQNICTGELIRRIGVINGYVGQQIPGRYITPDGKLSLGCTVLYVKPTPTVERIAAVKLGNGTAGSLERGSGDISGTRVEAEYVRLRQSLDPEA